MRSPYEKLEAWFNARLPNGTEYFANMVAWHLRHGHVFNTDRFFVMGRPIQLQSTRELTDAVIEGRTLFHSTLCNCWYFAGLSGNLHGVWKLLPFDLPYMAYHRMIRGKPRLFVRPLAPFRRKALVLDSQRN
jgi:hypothetical protein